MAASREAESSSSFSCVAYRVVPSQPLPVIDASNSLAVRAFGQTIGDRLGNLWAMGLHPKGSIAYRVGAIISILTLVPVSPRMGMVFAILGVVLAIPAHIGTMMLATNYPMMALLATSFEFWFLTISNIMMASIMLALFRDARGIVALGWSISTQIVVCMDANVRTRKRILRSLIVPLPSPVLVGCAFTFRWVDGVEDILLSVNGKTFSAVDVLGNICITVTVFFVKNLLRSMVNRSPPMSVAHSGQPVKHHPDGKVSCLIYRCGLKLQRTEDPSDADAVIPEHCRSPAKEESRDGRKSYVVQLRLRLSSNRSAVVRGNHTVMPNCLIKFQSRTWKSVPFILFAMTLSVGIVCPAVILLQRQPAECLISDGISSVSTIVGITGFAVTALICGQFILLTNRAILLWLLRTFDVIFASFQATMTCICLCDIVCWDQRSLAIWAFWIWFHWLLLLDGLVPQVKERLHFKKKYALPVMATILVGLVWLVHQLYFSSRQDFRNRVVWEGKLNGRHLTLEIYTFTASRLMTMIVLSGRIFWKLLFHPEDEFILIQGNVEYANPYHDPNSCSCEMTRGKVVPK